MLPIRNIVEDFGQRLNFADEARNRRILVQNGRLEMLDCGHVFANHKINPRKSRRDEEAGAGLFEDVHVDGKMLLDAWQEDGFSKRFLQQNRN